MKSNKTRKEYKPDLGCYECRFFRTTTGFNAMAKCIKFNEIIGSMYGFDSRPCEEWRKGRMPRKQKKQLKKYNEAERKRFAQRIKELMESGELPF